MKLFRIFERRAMRKIVKKNNELLMEAGLIAMRFEVTGNTTELRLNGRVLMIYGLKGKDRAAVDSCTALTCLYRRINAIDLPKLKEIALESALNSF